MRIVILVTLLFLSLNAEADRSKLYAYVMSNNTSLYEKPYECAKKKNNYFKKGDRLEIYYCNQYRWCKTKNGYVKRDLLKIITSSPKRGSVKPVKNSNIKHSKSDKSAIKVEVLPIFDCKPRKDLDEYDEYFAPKSTQVNMEDNRSL